MKPYLVKLIAPILTVAALGTLAYKLTTHDTLVDPLVGFTVYQQYQGGTGFASSRNGQLVTGSTTQALSLLATGSANTVLTMSAGLPTWLAPATSGTVTSVDASVPTGLSLSGNPITTSGTLAISYAAGFSGFLTASGSNWDSFYHTPSTRITAGTNLTWAGNTLNATGGGSTFSGLDFGTIGGSEVKITSQSFDANQFSLSNTASKGFVRLNWGLGGVASRSTANTWSALNVFSAGASVSTNFEATGTGIFGGDGGLYVTSVGAGNGTLGFNTAANYAGVNYAAGVTGAGFMIQYTNSDSTTRFYNESSVTAGSGHAHTTLLTFNPGSQGATLSVPFEVTSYASASRFFGGYASHQFNGTLTGPATNTLSLGTIANAIKNAIVSAGQFLVSLIIPSGSGGPTIAQNGGLSVDTASNSLNFYATSERVISPRRCYYWVQETPTAKKEIIIKPAFMDPFTITDITVRASGSNAAGWNIQSGATPTTLTNTFTSAKSASGSALTTYTTFNTSVLNDGDMLSGQITSASAVLTSFTVQICGQINP